MKTIKFLSMACIAAQFLASCSKDETPKEVNEAETITTMTVTLAPQGGGNNITLSSKDLDGNGPTTPVITVSGNLAANTTYNGTVALLNETKTPAENVNKEIEGKAGEHQFFYTMENGLNVTTTYADKESDYVSSKTGQNFTTENPVGIKFNLVTTGTSSGKFTVTLRHEPTKPNDGTLANAGGKTDIAQTFNLTIE